MRIANFFTKFFNARQESSNAENSRISEIPALVKGAQEHQIHPQGVRSEFFYILVRVHHIPARLGHFGAVFYQKPVRAEFLEGLVVVYQTPLLENFSHEADIEEM